MYNIWLYPLVYCIGSDWDSIYDCIVVICECHVGLAAGVFEGLSSLQRLGLQENQLQGRRYCKAKQRCEYVAMYLLWWVCALILICMYIPGYIYAYVYVTRLQCGHASSSDIVWEMTYISSGAIICTIFVVVSTCILYR